MASAIKQIRQLLLRPLKMILRTRIGFPVMVWYVCKMIRPVKTHVAPEFTILLLDYERWWSEDVRLLGSRVQLYMLPSSVRQRLTNLFLCVKEIPYLASYEFPPDVMVKKEQLVQYLMRLLKMLHEKKGIQCVMTVNHMYLQNKPIAEACTRARMPFVDLYKECMKDEGTVELFKKKCRLQNLNMQFYGHKICVYNQLMKDTFLALGVAKDEDIVVTGALRIESFLQRFRPHSIPSEQLDTVTLFSFRHIPVGANPREYVFQFSPDRSKGYVQLFDAVHAAWAELALRYPQYHFVIKLKWEEVWSTYIRRAMEASGFSPDRIPNLRIVALEEDAQDIILRSRVVAGLNSTTLLEARLAGRPVVIPFFCELADRYPETLLFRDVVSEFTLARSEHEFKMEIAKLIHYPPPFSLPSRQMITKYFGYDDGNALERVMAVLRSAQNATRQDL